jgi:RHS repeat-associated protein
VTTDFAYAPDGARYRQWTTGPSSPWFGPKTVYYVDKDHELVVRNDTGETVERTYVGSSVVVVRSSLTGREVRYQHLDRLGSLDAVTSSVTSPGVPPASPSESATEVLVDAHGYDPFGKPRAREWTPSQDRLHPGGEGGITPARGFTGHEHLDNLYLIHMNGRVYDYRLGRFLSVDPIISDPANSQSINPYSYLGNNPLSGTDPTGYAAECVKTTGSNVCNANPIGNLTINGSHIPNNVVSSPASQKPSPSTGNGATPQGSRTATANPAEHGSPPETGKADTDKTKEWPLSAVGSEGWRRGWKEAYGSEVTPGLGDRVSLGGKSWSLGEDPGLDEILVMFIEQKDRLAMSRAGGYGLAAGEAARLGVVALDASLARAATKAAGPSGAGTAAYEAAVAGGKHAGTLRNYAGRPAAEIEKAIASYERQVSLHQQKIANPAQYAERWRQMTAQQQAGLLNKWRADAARNQDLADVLRGLLGSR